MAVAACSQQRCCASSAHSVVSQSPSSTETEDRMVWSVNKPLQQWLHVLIVSSSQRLQSLTHSNKIIMILVAFLIKS